MWLIIVKIETAYSDDDDDDKDWLTLKYFVQLKAVELNTEILVVGYKYVHLGFHGTLPFVNYLPPSGLHGRPWTTTHQQTAYKSLRAKLVIF